jgi:hypothetical protein
LVATNPAATTLNVAGSNEAGDSLGQALASGDIDDDGFEDLVIGVPGEDGSSRALRAAA